MKKNFAFIKICLHVLTLAALLGVSVVSGACPSDSVSTGTHGYGGGSRSGSVE